MIQAFERLNITTKGAGLTDITPPVRRFIAAQNIENGLLTLFVRHTSASLVIQENADTDVLADLKDAFAKLAPKGPFYRHDCEGPDDMPAHIKAALTQTSIGIPIINGAMVLGTWQGIYLFEHRDRPHSREVILHLLGQ